jgi:hypothetical protein
VTPAYSTGSNPAVDLVDQAGANPLTVNILPNGNLDVASINTWAGRMGGPFLASRGVLAFSLMEGTEIGEVSRAGRSGRRERCDHNRGQHDPAPPLVLYGGSSGHFGLCGEVDETVRPCGQILREFGVGLLVRFFYHARPPNGRHHTSKPPGRRGEF